MRKNYKREYLSESARVRRRSQRIEEMKRQKQRQERMRRLAIPVGIGLLVCILLIIVVARGLAVRARRRENPNNTYIEQAQKPQTEQQASSQPAEPERQEPNASEQEPERQTPNESEQQASGASEQEPEQQTANESEQQASNASEQEPEQQASSAFEQESEQQASKTTEPESSEQTESKSSQKSEKTGIYAVVGMQGSYAGSLMGQAGRDDAEELWEVCKSGLLGLGGLAKEKPPLSAVTTEQTIACGDEMFSENVVFINASEGTVLAQKGAWTTIPPASMTKILTVLVAAEHVTDIEDTFTMTKTAIKYGRDHGCTAVGFVEGEKVALRDLFYGTVVHSGADAAVGLAEYVAGSQEAFVELMNERLEQLGVSDTAHFTNCVGVYDVNHYCTVYDMAVIMKAAYDNPFCRQVLSAHIYTTGSTPQHPEGIEISNWFLRRIEDKDTHGEVLCGKTGYVDASGNCAASLLVGSDGTVYICTTVHAPSKWRCIEDHVALYQRFVP